MTKDISVKINKWEELPYNTLVIIKKTPKHNDWKVNISYFFGFIINYEGTKCIGCSSLEYGNMGKYGGEFYTILDGNTEFNVIAYYPTTLSLPHPDRWNENFLHNEVSEDLLIAKLNINENFNKTHWIYL